MNNAPLVKYDIPARRMPVVMTSLSKMAGIIYRQCPSTFIPHLIHMNVSTTFISLVRNSQFVMSEIERRQLLKSIGMASGSALIAGCSGGDDEENEDLGERVPTISFQYYNWDGGNEAMAPHIRDKLQEMGFDVEVRNVEPAVFVEDILNDTRAQHLGLFGHTPGPDRLDPHEFVIRFAADRAGTLGNGYTHYTDCEYTELAHQQSRVADEEERRELVYQAQEKFGENYVLLTFNAGFNVGVARKDQIDLGGVGDAGINIQNYHLQIKSETDKDVLNVGLSTTLAESLHFLTQDSASPQVQWFHVPNSCLFEYDENYELQHVLTESSTWANNAQQLTVKLRDGTFHNGEPITAEDVKFTFEHLNEYPGQYPIQESQGFESINVLDEKTIEFNFENPNPIFQTRYASIIPIIHKETFVDMGVDEDPENFDMTADNFVGSGPFTIDHWERGRLITLTPHDGHPFYSPPDHDVNWIIYEDGQPRVNAFRQGEVDLIMTISQTFVRQLEEEMSDDELEVVSRDDFGPSFICPQHTQHPTQFKEFRQAFGIALDRDLLNEADTDGQADVMLACTMFPKVHPWRAPDEYLTFFTDDPTGDMEEAEQVLLDAGWAKDNDGAWHYPPDKDLTPPWPEGENPDPDDFACLDEDGSYAG